MNGPIYLFTARTIPVFVQPWYLLLILYMVFTARSVTDGAIWAGCVTFSILVHEFGHGLAALWYKLEPSIVLHGWGGMCVHARARRDRDDAVIVIAGPLAGLLLGGVVLAASWGAELAFPGVITSSAPLTKAVDSLLFVNLFWSLVNLVPMFPLDGGLLFRLGAHKLLRPGTAERVTHGTGLALAAGWAVVGSVVFDSSFMVIMGLMFAYQNFQVLAGRTRAPKARVVSPQVLGLLDEVRKAWASGEARETVRLCHMLRSTGELPPPVLEEAYSLIVTANVALGQHEEALSWARYAPVTGQVVEARVTALAALGRGDEARAVLAEHGAALSGAARGDLEKKLST